MMKYLGKILLGISVSGCAGLPDGITPVQNFDAERYMGTWYEIARLDHKFERGLSNVTAEYTLQGDEIRVINRGYNSETEKWQVAQGKAHFAGDKNEGYLKVSFFGPFYSSYVIFELDNEFYDYAFVSGPDKSYLWLLARKPFVSDELMESFLQVAEDHGFVVDQLIFVEHDTPPPAGDPGVK